MKIFNLEFPSYCHEINIFGYRFIRVENYEDQLKKLQHLGTHIYEFQVNANSGQHAVTADVILSKSHPDAVLKWANKSSALDDILLLLSIFTGRDVFSIDEKELEKENLVFLADSRQYHWGGILQCSIPYKGQPIKEEIGSLAIEFNIGFEEGINQVYDLVRSSEWQKKYHQGDFLFLSRTAFRRQPINSTFIQCWAIWEHLFAIINRQWLTEKQLYSLNTINKIGFLLVEFGLINSVDSVKERIEKLISIRNRLIHYGAFPEPTTYFKNAPKHTAPIQTNETILSDAELFIRLTETILSKILGLIPSNVFNTEERFEKFLKRNERT